MSDAVAGLGTILGVWAHPDDEAYLMGGVLAMAIDAGQQVALVTATFGDAGETADPSRWPQQELRRIRSAELHESLGILGVRDHTSLDLPDGGLADLDATEPVAAIVTVMERVRPDTVITFGVDGMTGHPDHTAVSDWSRLAILRATTGPRLLTATKTSGWVEQFPDINAEVFPPGLPPRAPTQAARIIRLDDTILERKVRALEAHASQTTGMIQAYGRDRYAEWVRLEVFQEQRNAAEVRSPAAVSLRPSQAV